MFSNKVVKLFEFAVCWPKVISLTLGSPFTSLALPYFKIALFLPSSPSYPPVSVVSPLKVEEFSSQPAAAFLCPPGSPVWLPVRFPLSSQA